MLPRHDGHLWVGVGSDHTARDVEAYGVAVAKQLCEKPIAAQMWPYEDLAGRWDDPVMRSWVDDGALYQDGAPAGLMCPDQLLAVASPRVVDGTLMFCGTLAAIGGVRPSALFRYELEDPATGRNSAPPIRLKSCRLSRERPRPSLFVDAAVNGPAAEGSTPLRREVSPTPDQRAIGASCSPRQGVARLLMAVARGSVARPAIAPAGCWPASARRRHPSARRTRLHGIACARSTARA